MRLDSQRIRVQDAALSVYANLYGRAERTLFAHLVAGMMSHRARSSGRSEEEASG